MGLKLVDTQQEQGESELQSIVWKTVMRETDKWIGAQVTFKLVLGKQSGSQEGWTGGRQGRVKERISFHSGRCMNGSEWKEGSDGIDSGRCSTRTAILGHVHCVPRGHVGLILNLIATEGSCWPEAGLPMCRYWQAVSLTQLRTVHAVLSNEGVTTEVWRLWWNSCTEV
jgi:hypothetical protein